MSQTDSNRYWICVDIDHSQSQPSKSITTMTDYNPVYNFRSITTQIDYDIEKFWVLSKLITSEISVTVVVIIDRKRLRLIKIQ